MAHFRCSLSNSTGKVTHSNVEACVETDVTAATSTEGLLALETIPTRELRYNYVCNPNQMPLDRFIFLA